MAHEKWMRAYLQKIDGQTAPCPECGAGDIEWRLAGDPQSRFGFAVLWCHMCRMGDYLSRVRFPEGVEFVSMFDNEAVAKGIPSIKFVGRT